MIVTPRDIDRSGRDVSKLIGYAIDLALHDGLTIEDVDMFLS
jgi:spore protease